LNYKNPNDFQLVGYPGSTTVIDIVSAGTGTHGVGLVIGKAGDSTFAVVGLGPVDVDRVVGSKFNFKGSNYTVTQYDSPDALGKEYGGSGQKLENDKYNLSVKFWEGNVLIKKD
jgi:hypothetical protein